MRRDVAQFGVNLFSTYDVSLIEKFENDIGIFCADIIHYSFR